ncbi:hypothetical protein [Sphingobium yanoikuyae]|jgi:hypothetical protein|uniref:hypothetical protein n=1 Tax=Sphingobium yanoikuyae TaxID=13690 RepID=UPI00241D12D3|nr:hypothetical protein [Sphingobium yanoikuyae]
MDGMDDDGVDSFAIFLEPDFPLDEVEEIGSRLMSLGCLVPGFVAPPVGLLDIRALTYAEHVDGLETVLVVDRNLASRMAQLANEGGTPGLGSSDRGRDQAHGLRTDDEPRHRTWARLPRTGPSSGRSRRAGRVGLFPGC